MVFTTHLFVFYFLPLFLLTYYVMPFRWRTGLIGIASLLFYAWANPWWCLVMMFSTTVDYLCGRVLAYQANLPLAPDGDYVGIPKDMPRTTGMKLTMWVSVISNLLFLMYFKYIGFATENLAALAEKFGMGPDAVPVFRVILPIGISFYTFQSMSYCIDIYRGDARPMRRIMNFFAFETLYPQLVAGPIVRYLEISEQLNHRVHTVEKFARGVAFFAMGMAMKILLANPMGHVADRAFDAAGLAWYDAWYGVVAYAFQIYFDFAGYSNMAIGLALMIGFVFPQNFNQPYRADSITDFWRRWHITLSTFLRDYLYIPLGGNRLGGTRTYVNLMTVMVIGGFWHGASWNFIIWGAIHGVVLAAERMQGKDSFYRSLPRPLRVGITFAIVCLAWVFFRADTLPQAWGYLASLFGLATVTVGSVATASTMYTPYHVIMFLIAVLVVWKGPETWVFTRTLDVRRAAVCMTLLAVSIVLMWSQAENPFLYFRF